jgi:hypothetical protein
MTTALDTWAADAGKTVFPISVSSVAAAGNSQSTAVGLTSPCTLVTDADGTKAARLPAATVGAVMYVINPHATLNLPIYPATGEEIRSAMTGALGANQPINVGLSALGVFVCPTTGLWYAVCGTGYYGNNSDFSVGTGIFRGAALHLDNGVGTVAAAGNAQGNAGAITKAITYVTDSDGTKGVVLPAAASGIILYVYNTVAANLKIYPASGDDINDGTTDVAITIDDKSCVMFVAVDATTWMALGGVITAAV